MATGREGDRRWILLYAVFLAGITAIPYLIGFYNQGEEYVFTGSVFGVNDGNSYIAKMLSGDAGAWLFTTPYTSFPQAGVLAYIPYLLLGKLASPPDLHHQLIVLFQLFRIVSVFLVVFASYDFLSLFTSDIRFRRLGLVMITLGGGLGWLLVLAGQENWLGSLPLEFYSPESFGFLGIFGLPHLALGRALLLWGFVVLLKSVDNPRSSGDSPSSQLGIVQEMAIPGCALGAIWLGLGLAQPVTLALAWLVSGAYLFAGIVFTARSRQPELIPRWGWIRRGVVVLLIGGLVSSPIAVYTVSRYFSDPFFRLWAGQNLLPSPHPAHYLLAYGLAIPLVIMGMRAGMRSIPRKVLLPSVWVILLPVLAYLPVGIQRRLPEGIWVAITTLTVVGLEYLASRWPRMRRAAYLYTAFSLPASFLLLIGGTAAAADIRTPLYRPAEEVSAFESLASHAERGDLVLSAFETGNALPAWAPLRVVIGHGPESVEFEARQEDVKRFFESETPDAERREIIRRLGVDYIFWGPAERRLGGMDPRRAGFLTLVIEEGEYQVYEISTP